jgi:hypothetical protein
LGVSKSAKNVFCSFETAALHYEVVMPITVYHQSEDFSFGMMVFLKLLIVNDGGHPQFRYVLRTAKMIAKL